MRFLAVDDEPYALEDLEEALGEAAPGCEVAAFTSPEKALAYAADSPVDTAFLDIEMGSMNGIVMAKRLKDMQPKIKIIFVTGYEEYAVDAFRIHASGYLTKPVTTEDISRELTFLYGEMVSRKEVRVQTFGGFAMYVNEQRIEFKRSKTTELMAYLVDRRGVPVTTREACNLLWEDKPYGKERRDYFQTLMLDMRTTLKKYDVEYILSRSRNSLAIDPNELDCDSYRFLEGDPWAVNCYRHDYLPGYSWAEFRIAELGNMLGKKIGAEYSDTRLKRGKH